MAKQAATEDSLRVGELARRAGVSADTLRYYERRGLLAPDRTANGYRQYPAHAVARVKLIRCALAIGFKLDDLARIFKIRDAGGKPCQQVRTLAEMKLAEVETLVREAMALRDGLRELLQDWDRRLDAAAEDEPAKLLETLTAADFVNGQTSTPLRPLRPKRKTRKEGK